MKKGIFWALGGFFAGVAAGGTLAYLFHNDLAAGVESTKITTEDCANDAEAAPEDIEGVISG